MEEVSLPVSEVGVYQLRRVGPPSTVRNSASLIRLQENGEVTVGRGPTANYFLDSAVNLRLISRVHASIKGEKDLGGHPRFTIINSGLNGTYINDRKMGCYPNNYQVLLEGDKITFGHTGCSSIQTGEHAPQLDSEFQFIFECVPASRAAPSERYRNHSRALPLSGNPRHSHLQKHSSMFKASNTVPRLTDSPLSNASTSEKENEVTSSVCQDVKSILTNGVSARSPSNYYHCAHENVHLDSKLNKVIKYDENTDHVFSSDNRKLIGVGVSDILPNPVFPVQLGSCNPKLCFYSAGGGLTGCDPSEFLSYTDIVKSFKSMSSHKEHDWDIEECGDTAVSSSHFHSPAKVHLPSNHETIPPVSLVESFEKPGESFIGGIEVKSTVIILGDEVDDDDDDIKDDVDDNSRNSSHGSNSSLVEFVSESGPILPTRIVIKSETEESDDGAASVRNEDDNIAIVEIADNVEVNEDENIANMEVPDNVEVVEDDNIANMEIPDNVEVNFGIEDIVEVTVTTENGVIDSVDEDSNINNDNRENDAADDSDSSMPMLESIKDGVPLDDADVHSSEEFMPSLTLMNGLLPPKMQTSEITEPITGLSYNGDTSISKNHSHAKHSHTAAGVTCKASSLHPVKASCLGRSPGSTHSRSLSGVPNDLVGSQFQHENVKNTSVINTCTDFKRTEKRKRSKSRTAKPHAEAKCPKHNIHSKSDRKSSRSEVSDSRDKESYSELTSEFIKLKTVVQDDCTSQSVLSYNGSTKLSKTYKESGDTESISVDFGKERKKKAVSMTDSAAFRDAALKLKSVCSEVVSRSPLSSVSTSKSPSSYLFKSKSPSSSSSSSQSPLSTLSTSKSPPSSLPQSMTPTSNSSKSPSSHLHQSKSPLYLLPQSVSPSSYLSSSKSSSNLPHPKSSLGKRLPSKPQSSSPASPVSTLPNSALPRSTAPITHTTTIILSSGKEHKGKSSRRHDKSRKHKDCLHKQSSVSSSSTTRPSSRSSIQSTSSAGSHSNSRSSSCTSKSSSNVSSSKSRSSSDESLADSRSSSSSSHSRPPSGSIPHSRTSSALSTESKPSKSSSQNSTHSSRSRGQTFFKDTVPNLYSSSDEEDTVHENKTEIVKKIYSSRGKQEDAAGKGDVSRQRASLKAHKQSCPPTASTSSSKSSAAATFKQVSPPQKPEKSLKRGIRDVSPASSTSSNLSDVSRMEKKPKTDQGPKPEKKPEIKPVVLPQVAVKPKPLVLSQSVMQLNNSKPKPFASKQAIPSSPSLSLTSLPWMTDASRLTDTKPNSKKTASNKLSLNQKNGSSAVCNKKSSTSLPQIGGQSTSVKGALSSHVSPRTASTSVSKTSKELSSSSSFDVKTDKKSISARPTQSKPASLRDKLDTSTNSRTAKTNSTDSVSKGKELTPASGKTNNSGIANDSKASRSKEKKPEDPKTDQVNNRGKRARSHQSSGKLKIADKAGSESSDSEDEPPNKKRDLRPDTSRASSQSMARSLRVNRSIRSDKPEAPMDGAAGTRRRKTAQSDVLSSKTSTASRKSKQATTSKRGKSSKTKKNNNKKKRISDSSSDDDENKDDDDEEDDYDDGDISDSETGESWELPDGVQYYDNLCSAKKCLNPEGKQVDWVMCDHCEQWYHVVCVGCPIDALKEDAQFHCGFC